MSRRNNTICCATDKEHTFGRGVTSGPITPAVRIPTMFAAPVDPCLPGL